MIKSVNIPTGYCKMAKKALKGEFEKQLWENILYNYEDREKPCVIDHFISYEKDGEIIIDYEVKYGEEEED